MINFFPLIIKNLPVIQVLIPLLSGPICALLPNKGKSWLFAILVMCATFASSFLLFLNSSEGYTYAMGGWEAPIGIEYKIDLLSTTFLMLISFIGIATIFYSKKLAMIEIAKDKLSVFYGVFLICIAGYLGIILTNDIFNIYVFLEISSLASYSLIAMGKNKFAPYSAFSYLIFGTIAATFFLLGIGMLYMMTGTLNITDLISKLPNVINDLTVKIGFGFIITGCLLKAALFPMHTWLPNVYQNAPSPIAAFLASIASKVALYILIRFLFEITNSSLIFKNHELEYFLITLSMAAIIFGSISAIFQNDLKRLFAFSSISQIGYIVLAIALNSKIGLAAAIIFIINHAITKSALFMICGSMEHRLGTIKLSKLEGIASKMPWSSAALIINACSLVGLPLTAGFISKWNLVSAVLEYNIWLIIPVIISSILTFAYVLRIIETIYFKGKEQVDMTVKQNSIAMNFAICILTSTNILLGLFTYFNHGISISISNLLFR